MLPQNVVRKHLHNIMATFIHIATIQYSQCCGNVSAIWENPCISYQDMLKKSDAHTISLADFMFHFRKTNAPNEMWRLNK